jgi:hypothetical protein
MRYDHVRATDVCTLFVMVIISMLLELLILRYAIIVTVSTVIDVHT